MNDENKPVTDIPVNPIEKMDVSLRDIFDTNPLIVPEEQAPLVIDAQKDDDSVNEVDADHAFARSNMYTLLQQGQSAFMYALEVAKQSENPRAFEVVGTMMKNLADMNNQLMDLHTKKTAIKKPTSTASEPSKVVNNSIVFQGSTTELNKMIQNMRKEQ